MNEYRSIRFLSDEIPQNQYEVGVDGVVRIAIGKNIDIKILFDNGKFYVFHGIPYMGIPLLKTHVPF